MTNKVSKKTLIFVLIILFIVTAAVQAERKLTGDKLDIIQTEKGRVFTAHGNVELIYDEIRVTAEDEGVYRRYNGEIEFRKNVDVFYQEYTAHADELIGNIEQKVFHLNGNAVLEGNEVYLEADQIDFYQAEDRMEAQGEVYIEYQDFWAKADQMVYYLDREYIELSGNVSGERNGEKFSAEIAEINQKTEEITLKGGATLTLPVEEDQNDN